MKANLRELHKNPLFYFGFLAIFLLGTVCFGTNDFSRFNSSLKNSDVVFFNSFFKNADASSDPFFNQNKILALETPDLKITQDNSISAVSPPQVLTPQVLGSIFGESASNTKEVTNYAVQPGDTIQSIADDFGVSLNTILWANSLSKNSTIKVGQTIVVLPVTGLIHAVKNGDTISQIAKIYKAKEDDIISFNGLTNEGDIFIGDILIIPDGTMPSKAPVQTQTPLAAGFFIFPTEGRITQGLHYYNAIDVANKCGTPVYAAAGGVVQRVKYGYNFGGGNYITILHSNGVATYYGHLMTIFVKPGDVVDTGERIALMGGQPGMAGAGLSTGCHLHFQVMGAVNPLAKYSIGTAIKYK